MTNFNPERIFIYEKIKDQDIVKKIVSQFSSAKIEYTSDQSPNTIRKLEPRFSKIQGKNKNAGIVNIAKKLLFIGTATANQFVEKFENKQDCLCPEFYCITPLNNGCYYSCMYCYLQMTYRGVFPYIKINVNLDELKKAIVATAKSEWTRNNRRSNFNCGEKLDSLSFDYYFELSKSLIPFFAETPELEHSTLLMLTKSDNVNNLIEIARKKPKLIKNTILSWSLNSEEFSQKYEIGSPSSTRRLSAAKKCQDVGYTIRLRIDPLLLLPNWQTGYKKLIQDIFETYKLKPEIITLGALRFETGLDSLAKERFNSPELFNYSFIVEGHDKHRYRVEDRIKLYTYLIEKIKSYSQKELISLPLIGLCKEKKEVWQKVGLNLKECHCNCVKDWKVENYF
ncbi:MAG: spore photoproduct lyase family protein [Promethearchaeota archaeon]